MSWKNLIFIGLGCSLALSFSARANSDDSKNSSSKGVEIRRAQMVDPLYQQKLAIIQEQQRFFWQGDETKPITRLEVRLSDQKIDAYQGAQKIAEGYVSTGKKGHETPPGSYSIIAKKADQVSSLYGEFVDSKGTVIDWNAKIGEKPPEGCHYEPSPMPYYLRVTDDGVGIHAGFLPGRPDSHGCIRIAKELAAKMFNLVDVGTPVVILP